MRARRSDISQGKTVPGCAHFGETEELRELLNTGHDPNIRNIKSGFTAAHHAATKGDLEMLRLLASHRADFDLANYNGAYPLHFAASHRHIDAVQFLLDNGAHIDAGIGGRSSTPLNWVSHDDTPMFRFLLDKQASPNVMNLSHHSPLAKVIMPGHIIQVCLLLQYGAGPNLGTCDVWRDGRFYGELPPLHLAAFYGMLTIAEKLIEAGASEQRVRCYGLERTALEIANVFGHPRVAALIAGHFK